MTGTAFLWPLDPVYERVGSLRHAAAKEPLGPKLSTNSEAYCSIDSINAKGEGRGREREGRGKVILCCR